MEFGALAHSKAGGQATQPTTNHETLDSISLWYTQSCCYVLGRLLKKRFPGRSCCCNVMRMPAK